MEGARHLVIAMVVIGLLAIPAVATAKGGGKSIDRVAARACAKERHKMGKKKVAFPKKYGARASMRACVRRTRGKVRSAQSKAIQDCLAELQANPAEFAEDYGDETGAGAGAFEECVAETTESYLDPDEGRRARDRRLPRRGIPLPLGVAFRAPSVTEFPQFAQEA
jgi:hypothetical protein